MEERKLRALVGQVKAGTLSRRRFVRMMVGLGLTAPMAAQMLAAAGVAQAQPKWTVNPTKRGGGGLVKALWWQAPTLLNPHFANGTKDQDACRIFYEPLGGYDQKTQQIVKQSCAKAGIDLDLKAVLAGVYFSSDPANPDTYSHFYTALQM